jgi:hypothetical protein
MFRFSHKLTKRPIGRILVNGGFISERDLELALQKQKETSELLGQVLLRMGMIMEAELNAALSVQRDLASSEDALRAVSGMRNILGELLSQAGNVGEPAFLREPLSAVEPTGLVPPGLKDMTEAELDAFLSDRGVEACQSPVCFRLGEILVASGLITRRQLEEALERQKYSDKKIGELLVEAGHVEHHHVSAALSIQRKLIAAALAAALSLSATEGARAQDGVRTAKAAITVTAMVKGYADLKILHQTPEVVITAKDVERGYAEVPAATTIDIKSNTRYLLAFEGLDEPFKEVRVSGLKDSGDVVIAGSGFVELPYTQPGKFLFVLGYRFRLAETAHPGTYAWPIRISIVPL